MNIGKILASATILSLLLSSMGCGGSPSGQSSQQTDLIGGLGAALGIKQQKIDLLKKGVGVVQAMEPIGEEEEITLGEAVAVEAFSRFGGEYSNPAWTRYINLVGKTVAEVSDRPTLNYHFAILNSQEQNAFAAPGGYIFITVGLLKTLNNEAELAGVLAHEIAHVTQKHMLDAIRRGALMGSVSELSLTAMKQDPAMFSSVIDEMTDLLFTKGLDKDKEFEADVVGVEYAYRAGYNPQGLEDYLQTLAKEEGHVESKFFTTHPSTTLRISKIDTLLKDYSDIKNLPFLTERFHQYVKAG
ncbi:MAG: peptidase M48 [Nitrospirales bacterium]|nr:MAG: peptidase M48 [Nitrospirales bacterium]